MIVLSGHQEQKTKEYVKFLALKVVAVALNIWEVVAYERVFETVFNWETKQLLFYKWLLTGGVCLGEVVAMKELNVLLIL